MTNQKTRQIHVGNIAIGGGAPIVVQSMTNTDTRDAEATLAQIRALAQAGCEVVRCAVPDAEAARALETICGQSPIPVVADIRFDYRLALDSIAAGVHKIRLNPGNIGSDDRVKAVVQAGTCQKYFHSHRCQFRLGGKAYFGKVWRTDSGGACGKCALSCVAFGKIRFL